MRRVLGVLAAWCLALGLAPGAASAANKCAGAKLAAVAKSASCLLPLEAKEAKRGLPPDPAKLARCRAKLAKAFAKAEAKRPCATTGDSAAVQARVDAFVAAADAALSVGVPSKCQASKLRATATAASRLLQLRAKTAKKDAAADPKKVARCEGRLDAGFAKAERKPTCGTTGDAAATLALVDAANAALTPQGGTSSLDRWSYEQVTSSHEQTFGLAFGDVDQDGLLDIVSGPTWYQNPGGAMAGPWSQSPAFPGGVHAMLAVDVDGDALVDLIAQSNSGADVYWLEATSAAATSWRSTLVGQLPASSHALGMQGYRAAQIEAGGRPELLFSSGGGISYFRIPGANPEAGAWPAVRVSANRPTASTSPTWTPTATPTS